MLDVGYTSPILGVGFWQYSTCIRWRLYIHTRCWMLAILYLYRMETVHTYQVFDFLHPPVNLKLQNDINIRCCVLATLYMYRNLYIHTRCWILATLYLYQMEPIVRCWLHYTYTRCWMLAILYMYLYQVLETIH